MRTPLIFSLVRDQSLFMTAIMSLLTFLSVLSLGIALSIGTGVIRWNSQWDLFATVQVLPAGSQTDAKKVLDKNANKFASIKEISNPEMEKLLRPWMSGSANLTSYLPKMYEIKFRKKSDIDIVAAQITPYAKFMTHATALKSSSRAGWHMIGIASLVLLLTIGAIGVCISYIAMNTAMLHKRELEILNQLGAHDSFVARQMQIIVARICGMAGVIGFIMAVPVLFFILSAAHSARVGLMAMIGLSTGGWIALLLMPILITGFAIWMTKKTTLKILDNN